MKKLNALAFSVLVCLAVMSCIHNGHDVSISYSEDEHSYSMKAHFPKSETRDVDEYMDDRIGRRSNMSFISSRIDSRVPLDDRTTFYIKKSPGFLEIEFNKDENTDEAYHTIKSMCEGIKKVLTK